jgi:hypothetical protein
MQAFSLTARVSSSQDLLHMTPVQTMCRVRQLMSALREHFDAVVSPCKASCRHGSSEAVAPVQTVGCTRTVCICAGLDDDLQTQQDHLRFVRLRCRLVDVGFSTSGCRFVVTGPYGQDALRCNAGLCSKMSKATIMTLWMYDMYGCVPDDMR